MKVKHWLIAAVALFVVGMLVGSGHAVIKSEDIAAVWLLDEGEGVVVEDSSGNGHEGQVKGSNWIDGKFGKAVGFPGGGGWESDCIRVPSEEFDFFGTDSFTVVLWFNFSTPQSWQRILRTRESGGWAAGEPGWDIQTENVGIHCGLSDSEGNFQDIKYETGGDGEWHHAAMVVDRDKELLITYLDGADEKTASTANVGSIASDFPITMGGTTFAGAVDEVGIFNVTLTQDDVVEIINKGLAEVISGAGIAVSPSGKLASAWGSIKKQ